MSSVVSFWKVFGVNEFVKSSLNCSQLPWKHLGLGGAGNLDRFGGYGEEDREVVTCSERSLRNMYIIVYLVVGLNYVRCCGYVMRYISWKVWAHVLKFYFV